MVQFSQLFQEWVSLLKSVSKKGLHSYIWLLCPSKSLYNGLSLPLFLFIYFFFPPFKKAVYLLKTESFLYGISYILVCIFMMSC